MCGIVGVLKNIDRLPDSVINRKKLAFQDGTGIKKSIEKSFGNRWKTTSIYKSIWNSEFNKNKNQLGVLK